MSRSVNVARGGALGRIFAVLLPAAIAIAWVTASWTSLNRLFFCLVIIGRLGGYLFFRWGIPADLRTEVLGRMPPPLGGLLEKLVAGRKK
jgi:hypothetical protein